MANEVTVPLLPCASIDDIADFYTVLGFQITYRQRKPNPHVALQREDLNLHFFEMDGFDPEQSYGSCLVLTPDLEGLHRAFADGMRAAYGKVLVTGTPRMTRPRARKNYGGIGGFSVVDPGGNWIRMVHHAPDAPQPAADAPPPAAAGPLAGALANAVVQADSRGDLAQAVKILDGALRKPAEDPVVEVEALVFRAELAVRADDQETAAAMLSRAERVELTPAERERAAPLFDQADDLRVSRNA
jgi:hypothetical protein